MNRSPDRDTLMINQSVPYKYRETIYSKVTIFLVGHENASGRALKIIFPSDSHNFSFSNSGNA